MTRLKYRRQLKALLFAITATICMGGVDAQDEAVPSFTQEGFTFDFGFEPAKPVEEGESPLRSVTFDEFDSVAADETTDESPKAQSKTEIVGNVKYDPAGEIILSEGQTYELKTSKAFEKFQTDAEILKAENDSMQRIYVTGKTLGTANLYIIFEDGSSQSHSFRVKSDSDSFESIIKQLFPKHQLEIVPIRDTAVFLRGTAETAAEVQQIEEIAGEFWPTVHNHIQTAQDPSTQVPKYVPVYTEDKGGNIPKGMRVITVPVMEWSQNPNGPQFNKIVSLFSTEPSTGASRNRQVFTGDERLVAHNLQVFAHSGMKTSQDHFHVSLLVTPEQVNLIKDLERQGLKLILVSQVVNQSNPWNNVVQPLPSNGFLPQGAPIQTSPAPIVVQPDGVNQPIPYITPTSPLEPQPLMQPQKKPTEALPTPRHVDPISPSDSFNPFSDSPVKPDTSSPTSREHFDYPVPHSFDVPQQNAEPTPFIPDATPATTSALQADVRALQADVKKLIEILEKRQAKKEKNPVGEETTEVIPKKGRAVLFFHAAWGGPSQKMKSIVKKLHEQGLSIVSIDIDQHPEISKRYNIDRVPTFQQIEDSIAVPNGQISGLITEEKLRKFVLGLEEHQSSGEASIFSILSDSPKVIRITVQDSANSDEHKLAAAQRSVTGSGLLIQQSKGKATVLTTAHLFRGTKIDSENPILFSMTTGETFINLPKQAKLVASDVDADLALIEIIFPELPFKLKPVHLSPSPVKKGSGVFFVGYSVNDEGLTCENGQIISVDKYAGPSNFQIAETIATNGMSGSPVFDEANRLCGIVTTVDSKDKQTVCTGLEPIKELLKKAKVELPEDFNVEFTR